MKGFKNLPIYIEGEGVKTVDLAVENGRIVKIGQGLEIDEPYIKSGIVVPGFIDEHVHGAAGCDAMDGEKAALSKIACALCKEGTTSFLATTMTQSPKKIEAALTAVASYIKEDTKEGAKILGVHLEGPFISEKHIGAQPLEYVAAPELEVYKKYEKASNNNIKIVTLAPEKEGANELIAYLTTKNTVASAGHTDAGSKDLSLALQKGLRHITHTYNAQKPLHHREIGTVGAALLQDELYCELIADCIHVSIPAMKLLIKSKPKNKVILITDAMRAKHLSDGKSELGGQTVIVKNGEARLVDGTLAGSVLKMNDAVKNIVEKVGVSFTEAIDFATKNPATSLGVYDTKGSIKVGKDADFAVLDDNFNVLMTIRQGEIIYKA